MLLLEQRQRTKERVEFPKQMVFLIYERGLALFCCEPNNSALLAIVIFVFIIHAVSLKKRAKELPGP